MALKTVPGLMKLELISALTMALIFGAISGILALVLWYTGASGFGGIMLALFFSLVMLLVQWYLGPSIIKFITRMRELKEGEAPEVHAMVERISKEAGIPKPKLYLVDNPTPNAFAFGRTQKSANIALHTGLLKMLDEDEVEGVVAHEIGHIKHRDVLVMTIASVLPILLYYIVLVVGGSSRDRDDRGGAGSFILVWLGAQFASFLGQLLVLWLSRKREYYADAFSAYVTGKPASLMNSLAKISYAAAAMPAEARGEDNSALKAFYIASPGAGEKQSIAEIARAINSGSERDLMKAIEKEKRMGALEFLMTHPLTAKRLEALLQIKRGMSGG